MSSFFLSLISLNKISYSFLGKADLLMCRQHYMSWAPQRKPLPTYGIFTVQLIFKHTRLNFWTIFLRFPSFPTAIDPPSLTAGFLLFYFFNSNTRLMISVFHSLILYQVVLIPSLVSDRNY